MLARRRPVAALFSALLVWLSAAMVARVGHSDELRLVGIEIDGSPQLAITVARPIAAPARLPSQSSTIPRPDVPFAPAPVLELLATPPVRFATIQHARAKQAIGLARTHDATGPPATHL